MKISPKNRKPIISQSVFELGLKTKNFYGLYQIFDPDGDFLSIWNHVFLALCLVSLFVDPFFFYVPQVGGPGCIETNYDLLVIATSLRCLFDFFYLIHVIFKFRTAFILPGSAVIGRGDLVMDLQKIKKHYMNSAEFVVDVAAAFPLPQMIQTMNWSVFPKYGSITNEHANNGLVLLVLIQYIPRFYIIFPLTWRIIKNSGFVIKTAVAGAAYNLLLYMLSSHVFGAAWYLSAIQNQYSCWAAQCRQHKYDSFSCHHSYLDCKSLGDPNREDWMNHSHVLLKCDAKASRFKYGIFADALTKEVLSLKFSQKFLYCMSWGLKNLSSYGQNLETSGGFEIAFCVLICVAGVVLFCHLIANIQMYMQSMVTRLDKWRLEVEKTNKWMKKRQLPLDLQERIHKFWHLKWLVTRGIDEGAIIRFLPQDFRSHVQRHLCLHLVNRVHFFSRMDNQLLDAICERLVSSWNLADAFVVREGDPVDEMLFIIRGKLKSFTTDGGRTGFFNSVVVGPGDYCGEELLTWALMPNPSNVLPSSTRSVQALSDVEAFALGANDLKYVSDQFRKFHSMEIQQIFRFYSHQWRTWGACCIQAAWKRFKKNKLLQELQRSESMNYNMDQHNSTDGVYGDTGAEYMNKLATTYWAASTIQAAWRRYRNKMW